MKYLMIKKKWRQVLYSTAALVKKYFFSISSCNSNLELKSIISKRLFTTFGFGAFSFQKLSVPFHIAYSEYVWTTWSRYTLKNENVQFL